MSLSALVTKFIFRHWRAYGPSAVMLVAIALLTVWLPRQVGHLVDGLVARQLDTDGLIREVGLMVLAGLAIYAWLFTVYPLFTTMIQNLIWNHTKLEQHQFKSEMKWGRLTFITLTNLLGIVCTLGLFTPFAQVRALRYRLESTSLQVHGSLDDFVADTQRQVSATGEGMVDLLDFDLSI